jgi:hypothetical protein
MIELFIVSGCVKVLIAITHQLTTVPTNKVCGKGCAAIEGRGSEMKI